jgi:riboflavin kinase/FMN adenylyltransferase
MAVEQTAVLTFDRHPLELVAPGRVPRLLTAVEHRLEILESLGVDLVGVLPFEQIRAMPPAVFIHQVLLGSLGAKLIVIGTNFRFGLDRAGDVVLLQKEGARHGFEVDPVELLQGDGAAVSSSSIRALLDEGDVEGAEKALGRPYELRGLVEPGDGRGRTIGFPTANLTFADELAVPARGVYAVRVIRGGEAIPGVANVGVRPTFGGGALVVEVHLLGFDEDLYGQELAVRFHRRLRDEQRFTGIDELVTQIDRDIEAARESREESNE